MNNYFCNSKRPHTIIKNLISELRRVEMSPYNAPLRMMQRLVKDVKYFELNEIDFTILRFFILIKLSNDGISFNSDNATYYNIDNDIDAINHILKIQVVENKKKQILYFLNKITYRKDEAIRLQNMENKRNSDLLFILNYCEI
jgi:hypothetical protein